jgi:hypothetical protein
MSVDRFVHVEKMEDPVGLCLYLCCWNCWSTTIKKLVVCSFFDEFGGYVSIVVSSRSRRQEAQLCFQHPGIIYAILAPLLARSLPLPMCRQTDRQGGYRLHHVLCIFPAERAGRASVFFPCTACPGPSASSTVCSPIQVSDRLASAKIEGSISTARLSKRALVIKIERSAWVAFMMNLGVETEVDAILTPATSLAEMIVRAKVDLISLAPRKTGLQIEKAET